MLRSVAAGFIAAGMAMIASCLVGIRTADADELLRVHGFALKWMNRTNVATTPITYALLRKPFVLAGNTDILSPDNCSEMTAFSDITSNTRHLPETAVKREFDAALEAWQAVADIRFVEIADADKADIVVGASTNSKGRAYTNLKYQGDSGTPATRALGGEPNGTNKSGASTEQRASEIEIEQAYICLDASSRWKVGFDGKLDAYDLRYTFMHEIGHAIGLDHPGRTGSVMAFRYDEHVDRLQPSDVRSVQELYGPAR